MAFSSLDCFGIMLHFSAITSSPLIHRTLSRDSVMGLSRNPKDVGHLKAANSFHSVYPNDKHQNSTHFLLHKEFLSQISWHALFPCDSPINCCFSVRDLPMHNKTSILRSGCNSSRRFQDSYSKAEIESLSTHTTWLVISPFAGAFGRPQMKQNG